MTCTLFCVVLSISSPFLQSAPPITKANHQGGMGGLLHYESNLKIVNGDTRKQTFPFQMNLFIFD